MPERPQVEPKQSSQEFLKGFDDVLHSQYDPRDPEGVRLSKAEYFAPIARCEVQGCGRWQRIEVQAVPNQSTEQAVAVRMQQNGWTKYQGHDICPACSGTR